MKDRIRQLMETQHMNQQTFSQLTGINSATLSNIFNGRTSPTLNQVTAIQKRFPSINLNWLLNGEGGMFMPVQENGGVDDVSMRSSSADPAVGVNERNNNSAILAEGMLDFGDANDAASSHQTNPSSRASHRQSSMQPVNRAPQNMGIVQNVSRRITEIRVFYDDQTWESFVPKK